MGRIEITSTCETSGKCLTYWAIVDEESTEYSRIGVDHIPQILRFLLQSGLRYGCKDDMPAESITIPVSRYLLNELNDLAEELGEDRAAIVVEAVAERVGRLLEAVRSDEEIPRDVERKLDAALQFFSIADVVKAIGMMIDKDDATRYIEDAPVGADDYEELVAEMESFLPSCLPTRLDMIDGDMLLRQTVGMNPYYDIYFSDGLNYTATYIRRKGHKEGVSHEKALYFARQLERWADCIIEERIEKDDC